MLNQILIEALLLLLSGLFHNKKNQPVINSHPSPYLTRLKELQDMTLNYYKVSPQSSDNPLGTGSLKRSIPKFSF